MENGTWANDVYHIEIMFANEQISVSVHKGESRASSPNDLNILSQSQFDP